MEIGGPVEERDPARDSMRESSVTQVQPEEGDAKNTLGLREASAGLHVLLNIRSQSRFASSVGPLNGLDTYCGDGPSVGHPAGLVPTGHRAPCSSVQPRPMWSVLPVGALLQC